MASLSERVGDLHASPIRAILEIAQQPHMISFAGGLPAPDSFDDLALPAPPAEALQYGPTEGEPALRRKIADELAALGFDCPAERVLILSGSQQGIDLVGKLVIDRGAPIAVETPCYLAALQVFRFLGADLQPVPADPLQAWARSAPRLAYVTPTFQNPTGHCMSAGERAALAAACDAHDVTLFEDDPYRDLAYDPCDRTPVCTQLKSASWVYQGSFSKTVAPGLRLGFLAASEDLFAYLVRLKQAADLHSNRVSQWFILRHLNDPDHPARLARLAGRYRAKRDLFDAALRRNLGDLATWETPKGGLFFWVKLNTATDTGALLARALQRNVAFMPGEPFELTPDPGVSHLRLNFSRADAASADHGLAVLAELLRKPDRSAESPAQPGDGALHLALEGHR